MRLHLVLGFQLLKTEGGNRHHFVGSYVNISILFQGTEERLEFGSMVRIELNRQGVIERCAVPHEMCQDCSYKITSLFLPSRVFLAGR